MRVVELEILAIGAVLRCVRLLHRSLIGELSATVMEFFYIRMITVCATLTRL